VRSVCILLGLFLVAYSLSIAVSEHDPVGYLMAAFGVALFLFGILNKGSGQ